MEYFATHNPISQRTSKATRVALWTIMCAFGERNGPR